MKRASEWQRPQTSTIFVPVGLPTYPLAGFMALISVSEASPPWQETQPKPLTAWISPLNNFAGPASRSSGRLWWQATQFSTCCWPSAGTAKSKTPTSPTQKNLLDVALITPASLRKFGDKQQDL